MPSLCDHITGYNNQGTNEAECLPWLFKDGTQDVQTTPWMQWSLKNFQCIQNSCTKVNKEVGCSPVTQMGQKRGTRIAVVADWMHNGRQMLAALCKRGLYLNKLLNKQMSCWLSETLRSSYDVTVMHGSGDITWKILVSRNLGQLIWLL